MGATRLHCCLLFTNDAPKIPSVLHFPPTRSSISMALTVQLNMAESSREERKAAAVAISNISHSIAKSSRMIILVGAGISTSAGIPVRPSPPSLRSCEADLERVQDFRSSKGLYSGSSSSGKELFSAEVFNSPAKSAQHLKMIARLKDQVDDISSSSSDNSSTPSSSAGPKAATATHDWFGELKRRGKLARIYTQNIDGFEARVEGLRLVKLEGGLESIGASTSGGEGKGKGRAQELEGDVVQVHGSIHAVRCSLCAWVGEYDGETHGVAFGKGETLNCPSCVDFGEFHFYR